MRFVLFCHSIVSDWNHGNAHFLRGVASELLARGHHVSLLEPRGGWSFSNLIEDAGPAALEGFRHAYPQLVSRAYDPARVDLDRELEAADVVLVHEWNPHELVERIGRHRASGGRYRLLFHDTHHRSVTQPDQMSRYDLEHYDGVLAFGEVIRQNYVARGWSRRAWTWHEAADVRVFRPMGLHAPAGDAAGDPPRASEGPTPVPSAPSVAGDVVWIGNWGDEERSEEIRQYLMGPVRSLGLRARVHGVRYPVEARIALAEAGITYGGWLPNYRVPQVFGQFRATVHIPRAPYVRALPGIPTIRVFEALACGVPLVSCWWDDCEGLFTPGEDFAVARTPAQMTEALRGVLSDPEGARAMAERGRRTVLARHTCGHRADELLAIVAELAGAAPEQVLMA